MITEKTELQELFDHAIAATEMVIVGESFMVRDLFTVLEWNRIPRGLRTKLGSMFLRHVQSQIPQTFVENGKTLQNQQIYKRVL